MADRSVPFDLQAERATLGSVLLDREAIIAVSWLQPDWFYLEKHALVFEAMQAISSRRVPPDLATVAAEMRARQTLDLVGGISYLGELAAEVPTAVHVEYYGRTVEKCATLRRLIETGGKIAAMGYDERKDLDDTLGAAEAALFSLTQRRAATDFVPMSSVVDSFLGYLYSQQDADRGVPTGLYDLDALLTGGGLQPSDLVILAARPSVGKTAAALTITYNASVCSNRHVGWFSLEMKRQQLLARLLAMHTGINTKAMRPGGIPSDRMQSVMDALERLYAAPISVDDTPLEKIGLIRSKARRLHAVKPLDLIIVDYLGLADAPGENRVNQVGHISRNLKAMARELDVPVLALAQLSRAGAGSMPELIHLRDSGEIEQDADIVLGLHRPDMVDKQTDKKGIVQIGILKQRNGELGEAEFMFDAPTTQIRNIDRYRAIDGY